jgi:hypothetical protein
MDLYWASEMHSWSRPVYALGWAFVAGVVFIAYLETVEAVRRKHSLRSRQDKERKRLTERIQNVQRTRQAMEKESHTWRGFAYYHVVRKVVHGDSGICSFYLQPRDQRLGLPPFHPGQHLKFQFTIEGRPEPIVRRYSLSDAVNGKYLRISVKLAKPPRDCPDAPPGLGSSFLHQEIKVQEGEFLQGCLLVAPPNGSFYLEPLGIEPVVLIGGGVGVTPVLSMFNTILKENPAREVWFFYGIRNSKEDILSEQGVLFPQAREIIKLHKNLHLYTSYSRPLEGDATRLESKPEVYGKGRIDIGLLKQLLPSKHFKFYICGPDAMMAQLVDDLEDWGVPSEHLLTERFGPVKKTRMGAGPAKIKFRQTGIEAAFSDEDGFILDLAERMGVSIPNDCRSGSCGTCQIGIVTGKVCYPRKPSFRYSPNHCLTCCSVPDGDLELDA